MTLADGRRILSVQSSVASGYVGNRAATFPLQLLGYDVSCINTVQFSTHTGYPTIKGQKLSGSDIDELFQGLLQNGIDAFEGLLTGYVPGVAGVVAITDIATHLKTSLGDAVFWVLDPVMGDEDRGLYVSTDIPPIYRSLMAKADIITPNQFELEVLAESKITDLASLIVACKKVHTMGVERIVVTTYRDPRTPESINVIGSIVNGDMFQVSVPYYARPYQGTGDLFAALLLAHSLDGRTLQDAVVIVLNSMRPILEATGRRFDRLLHGLDWKKEKEEGRGAKVCDACELRIVENPDAVLNPHPFYTAIKLS